MGRSPKKRYVMYAPPFRRHGPLDGKPTGRVEVGLDEVEALRLCDVLGMKQEEVAELLGVSRPTVTRLVERARYKVARALVEGLEVLLVRGDEVEVGKRWCRRCGGWKGGRERCDRC